MSSFSSTYICIFGINMCIDNLILGIDEKVFFMYLDTTFVNTKDLTISKAK